MADGIGHGPTRRRRNERRRRRTRRRAGAAVLFSVASTVLLLVTAGGLLGAADYASDLPQIEDLAPSALGENSTVFARDGSGLATIANNENRTAVPLWKISPWLQKATIAIEDRRFYQHRGIDYEAIARAMARDIAAGAWREGGSTLTQQLISARYIEKERTFDRKVKEAWLAVQLEKTWSKDKILNEYMNTIFYGNNAYGVEAAARRYFSKPARRLGVAQAALIAGLAQSPSEDDPFTNPKSAIERRNEVLDAMHDVGMLDDQAWRFYRKTGLGLKPGRFGGGRDPFVVAYVRSLLSADPEFGAERVRAGGLQITTTIDLRLQELAVKTMADVLRETGSPAAAVVSIKPRSGEIVALASSTQRSKDQQFNLAVQGRRQPGSTFKTMTLAAAIEEGINPATTRYLSRKFVCSHEDDKRCAGPGEDPWEVETADESEKGLITLDRATLASDNTVYAQLALDIGPKRIADMAARLGVTSKLDVVPSLTLGAGDVTPLELTSAYATLAAGGVYRKPRIVSRITDRRKKVLAEYGSEPKRRISYGVAYEVTKLLKQNAESGTGTRARTSDGRPQAGKTGTTDNTKDAWYCGYTPELATCVWVGYVAPRKGEKELPQMHNVASYRDGTRVVHEPVYGGTVPSDIWHVYMNEALEGVPATDWEAPRDPVDWQPFESRHTRRAQERDRSDDGFRRGGGGYRRQGPSSPSPSPSPSAPGPDAPAPGSPPAGPPTGTVVEPEIVIAPG